MAYTYTFRVYVHTLQTDVLAGQYVTTKTNLPSAVFAYSGWFAKFADSSTTYRTVALRTGALLPVWESIHEPIRLDAHTSTHTPATPSQARYERGTVGRSVGKASRASNTGAKLSKQGGKTAK
jgi:hypothetical protein